MKADRSAEPGARATALEVLDPGLLTLVQDLGRRGWAHVGVGRSGAADAGALRAANSAVGNDEGAAGLELLLGGMRLRARGEVVLGLAGAPLPLSPSSGPGPSTVESTRPGREHADEPVRSASARELGGWVRVVRLADGEELTLGRPERGVRTYVAVRGGIAVEPVLGSRASDRLGGIGPAPLSAGDVLPVGTGAEAPDERASGAVRDSRDEPIRAQAGAVHDGPTGGGHGWLDDERVQSGDGAAHEAPGGAAAGVDDDVVVLRVEPGPHAHWFDDRWPAVLCAPDGYTVLPASDRVAVRLDGPPLSRARGFVGRELAPVGLVPGAVQVPPDGRPVLFGVDHPVTGGYPVVAVVRPDDVDRLAQLRPGDPVQLALTLDR